jgi:hypothetical protein
MRGLVLFKIIFHCLLFFSVFSCQNNAKKRVLLEKQINHKIAEDIRISISKSIDGLSAMSTGIPIPISSIINTIITKEKQDSLIIYPIKPYLNSKLDKLTIKELERINKDKKRRYLVVYETVVENKNEIISDLSKQLPYSKLIIEGIIKHHK